MLKKLFTKYILEVVPSILATVVGAYIVTHYINAKTDTDKPKAAVAAPADETSKIVAPQTLKSEDTSDKSGKADSAKAEAARLKAEKLAADKAAAERAASERAEAAKKAAVEKLAAEKAAADKRERATAKSPPPTPVPSEATAVPDDKRDANDIARAAIERLRNAEPKTETPRVNSVVYAPAAAPQPTVQPLPSAVTVAPVPSEINVAPSQVKPSERAEDALRPTPPADIPSRPLDIRARQGRTSVTEDVVSAARSVFHAVVPDSAN